MKKLKVVVLLLAIFFLGFFLRIIFLKDLSLTFGYDQARDAFVTKQILNGDLKILGPPASTPGLYHGVFYYYFLAPAYLFGSGSPIIAAYWVALFNAATVFLVFFISFLISKSFLTAFLASILFAFSFEATQYATWLSNPTIGIWTVPLIYLGLWIWTKEKKKLWGIILTAIGLGLSIQAEIFLLYHAVPLIAWLLLHKEKINKKQIMIFISFLILSVSTMVASEIKFGFKSISGISSLLMSQDKIVAVKSLGDFFILFLNQIGKVFAYSSLPVNIGYGGIFVLFAILYVFFSNYTKKQKWPLFLVFWLFAHLTVVSVGGTSTPFLLVGIAPAVSILLGIFLSQIFSKKKILALFLLIVLLSANLGMILRQNPKGSVIFAIQKDMLLEKELKAIDYTYEISKGEPFSINSLTSPLWINIVWDYLYKWYGLPKYGYLPEWHGRDQVGQLGQLSLTEKTTSQYFLIIEPMTGIPIRYLGDTIGQEDFLSDLIDEKFYGELRVQNRLRRVFE